MKALRAHFSRERESDIASAAWLSPFAAACGDDNIFAAIHLIDRRSRVAGRRERRFPKDVPIRFIECPNLRIVTGGRDKEQTALGDHAAAVVFRTRVAQTLSDQGGEFAEGFFPNVFLGVQIDRVQRSPGGATAG